MLLSRYLVASQVTVGPAPLAITKTKLELLMDAHQAAPALSSKPVAVVTPDGPINTLLVLVLRASTQMLLIVFVANAAAVPVTAC